MLLSLTTPLSSNQTAYAANQGGIHLVGDTSRISTVRSYVTLGPTARWMLLSQSFQILLLRVAAVVAAAAGAGSTDRPQALSAANYSSARGKLMSRECAVEDMAQKWSLNTNTTTLTPSLVRSRYDPAQCMTAANTEYPALTASCNPRDVDQVSSHAVDSATCCAFFFFFGLPKHRSTLNPRRTCSPLPSARSVAGPTIALRSQPPAAFPVAECQHATVPSSPALPQRV